MSDEELIARLRKQSNSGRANHVSKADRLAAADRIEALIGEREVWKDRAMQVQDERDEALEWLSASQGYIADAVFALDKQEEAEAKLAALVGALEEIANDQFADLDGTKRSIRAALARVKDEIK